MNRSEAEVIIETAQKLVVTMGHPDLVMTPLQAEIYRHIDEHGPAAAGDIAEDFKKRLTSISGILRRMHEDGWLARENFPQDSGGYEWIYTTKAPS